MKKMYMLGLMLLLIGGLAACGGDSPSAQRVVSNWQGDLTHLSDAMDSMRLDDAFELQQTVLFDVEDEHTAGRFEGTSIVRGAYDDGVHALEFIQESALALDFMMDGTVMYSESIEFYARVVVVSEGERLTIYIHEDTVQSVWPDYADVEIADFHQVFGFDGTWHRFIFDDNMENIVEMELLDTLLGDMDINDLFQMFLPFDLLNIDDAIFSGFDHAMNHLQPFLGMHYYGSHDAATIDVAADDDNNVVTTITVDTPFIEAMIVDMMDALIATVEAMDDVEMPEYPYDDYKDLPEYQALLTSLDVYLPVLLTITYHPVTLDTITIDVDLLSVMQHLISKFYPSIPPSFQLHDAQLTTTVRSGVDIILPTDINDLNRAAQEMMMIMIADEILWDIKRIAPQDEGTYSLGSFDLRYISQYMFDVERSTLTFDNDDIIIEFYYIDGPQVFSRPVGYHALDALMNQFDNAVPSRTQVESILKLFDDETFHITRFIVGKWLEEGQ